MIATTETLATLTRMLDDAGFDRERPDPPTALRVFREFATVPVDCAEDGFLFQCGTFDFTGAPLFQLGFTRQFSHEADGEYAGMEQLSCTIYYAPADELRALDTNLWSFDCASPAEFFDRVAAMTAFQVPTSRFVPLRAEIDQEQV